MMYPQFDNLLHCKHNIASFKTYHYGLYLQRWLKLFEPTPQTNYWEIIVLKGFLVC